MYSDDEDSGSEKEPDGTPYVSRSGRVRKRPRVLAQDYVGYSAYVKLENMDEEDDEDEFAKAGDGNLIKVYVF